MLSTNMGMKSAFGLESLGTLWACLLPDRLTIQWYHDFLETVLLELLEVVPLPVRQKFFMAELQRTVGEDVWQWLNVTYSGRWIVCIGLVACPP
jgi:hypothetical protein